MLERKMVQLVGSPARWASDNLVVVANILKARMLGGGKGTRLVVGGKVLASHP